MLVGFLLLLVWLCFIRLLTTKSMFFCFVCFVCFVLFLYFNNHISLPPKKNRKHLRYCLRLATRTTINAPNNADLAVLGATAEQFGKFQHIFTLSLGEKEKIDASYVRIMEVCILGFTFLFIAEP